MRRTFLHFQLFKQCSFALFIFLFTGCFQATQNQVHSLPQWFINAPQNNSAYLYGSGQASTFKAAQNQALNDMASRLSVNVRSSINQNTKTYTNTQGINNYSKSVDQNIQVSVEEMGFTNAKVIQSSVVGNAFFVLMQVNRSEVFNNKLKAFEALHQTIEKRVQAAKKMSKLEMIYAFDELQLSLKEASKKAQVLNAINNAFDDKKYLAYYQDLLSENAALKQELKINVSSSLPQGFFATHLIESLNKALYKTVPTQADVDIRLTSSVNYSMARGWHIAKVVTTIKVQSQGKVVSTHTINSVGRSTSTQQNALIGASREFKIKLNQIGADAILFNK